MEQRPEFDFLAVRGGYLWVFHADCVENIATCQGTHVLIRIGMAETDTDDFCQVAFSHEAGIELLQTGHFFVVEPIGSLLLLQFVEHLCVELPIVNIAHIINIHPLGNLDTDVAAAGDIGKRMGIVGGSHERGEARTVGL